MSGSVPQPSAIAASEDALFVASEDDRIWKLAQSDGDPHLFATLPGPGRPAAMVLDENGGLYIARDGAGQVSFLTAAGQPGDGYTIPGPRVTVSFGGVELKDLYVTESAKGDVYKVRVSPARGPPALGA